MMSLRPWAAVALFVVLACGTPERFPEYTPDGGNPELLTRDDAAVYDAVLPMLVDVFQIPPAPGPPPGVEPAPERPPDPIRLKPYTSRRPDLELYGERWVDLAGRPLPAPFATPERAIGDFRERNRVLASLARYAPKHVEVEWVEDSPIAMATYTLTLPGYSADRQLAIVEVSVVTSGLSGGGMLVCLRKDSGTWRIVAKHPTWIS